ncbi:ABC transporter substrate-binding protein [Roseomonas marmotae]|uniref:ABC transporter substrate-binding protein n=1 Tax=Roseomonas marmotae TaxID=2768161 RepID=A0ABS3KH65_9PROT|nr:ABC transporter substrate-binding protein [Roseomonas marmotae]MBO1076823.1 ABC transporter substrate-binding protein [Roseomonas marmotae]QTI80989.1 ABC transporter substrate-binding protein [Roseomonas marmotae]
MHRRTLLQGAALGGLALARPALAQPTRGSTLRFVPQANLTALDPIWTSAIVTQIHGYHVFDTLYGVDGNQRALPQMAEGHTVSDDRRTWRIRLREGLRFHDGEPVLARDAAASLERWSKRDPFGQTLAKVVESWGTADDRTIEIKLTRPFPMLLDAIAKPDANIAVIMPERLARTDANAQVGEVIGSGPYRFLKDEFVAGSRSAYGKFDGYVPREGTPDWTSGGKVAHFNRVEWHVLPDPSTAVAALSNGEVDWVDQPLADLIPSLQRNRNVKIDTLATSGFMSLMRLNHLQPPFNNPKVRRAVALAVNQADYMGVTLGQDQSVWRECRSLFPCGTPWATEDLSELASHPRSLDRAKAALAESGYAGEKVVIINPTDFPLIGPHGQLTADLLTRIGMNVDLMESDWGTVVQRRVSREPVEKGGWSIFHTYGSSMSYISPAVSSLVKGTGASGWFGWYESPKMEEMIQAWLDAPDQDAQKKVADQINRLAQDDVATIPLGQFFIRTAYRNNLTGFVKGSMPYPWGVRPA